MERIENSACTANIRFGSDGNGIFVCLRMNGTWQLFDSLKVLWEAAAQIKESFGETVFETLNRYLSGETH